MTEKEQIRITKRETSVSRYSTLTVKSL